jgi:HlyD family secretion protein
MGIGAAVIAGVIYAFLPQPVRVDLARVARGPLQVSVEEDGKTRIKDRYIVSSPLAGRLLRIALEPGDTVEAGKTVLAIIEPSDPALLDPRARAEAVARVKAAEARIRQTGATMAQTLAAMQFSESRLKRMRDLRTHGGSTEHDVDEAEMNFRMRSEELRAAKFSAEIAQFELEQAQAALLRTAPRTDVGSSAAGNAVKGASLNPPMTRPDAEDPNRDAFFQIRSPINGRVLRKFQESATVLTAGTQLLQLGNPEDLEVEIDVLSADGVKISPGDQVQLEQWGGEKPLLGRVRLVEPSAFTKVSSLGVEEQRVNVIVDFEDPPNKRRTLGDAFRVEAKIIVWEDASVLQVPIGVLFRREEEWAVFHVRDGRARLRIVKVGHKNGMNAEILSGLDENDEVVFPSDLVVNGGRVVQR